MDQVYRSLKVERERLYFLFAARRKAYRGVLLGDGWFHKSRGVSGLVVILGGLMCDCIKRIRIEAFTECSIPMVLWLYDICP